MSNKIPKKNRKIVYERANYSCELTGRRDRLHLHHIVPRRYRNHQIIALILLNGSYHDDCHINSNSNLGKQLKLGLQKLYLKYLPESTARKLMGIKLLTGKLTRTDVINHFRFIEDYHNISKNYFKGVI